ncbi:MAG: ABC transporter permease [Eubacteriales bacterium]|nr:ABC transporter permease [Eubacteriales bacterium]
MTAGKLAGINVRGRMRDYLTFLISNCVLVAIFYIFAAIYYNDDIAYLKDSANFKPAFLAFAIVVLVFSAVFVWYSSSFFISKRKQEIATYLLVGMSKRQIFRMLFLEQIIIGFISMTVGLLVGILFYKLFAMALVNMVRVSTNIAFTISVRAIGASITLFLLLYVLNAILVSTLVHRVQLINLYTAKNTAEKKVRFNWFFGILGFVMLIGGYVKSVYDATNLPMNLGDFWIILLLVIIGTYLFMGSFLSLLIRWLSRNKKRYYKARNLTSLSQLKFRIKSNAVSLATIAILNAMVLTALGSMWSVYTTQEQEVRYYMPFDMQYTAAEAYDDVDGDVDAVIAQYDEISVAGEMRLVLPRMEFNDTYKGGISEGYVISQSQFNEAAKFTGQAQKISLRDNEMLYTDQSLHYSAYNADYLENMQKLNTLEFSVNDASYTLNIVDVCDDKITNGYTVGTVAVVSDNAFAQILKDAGDNVAYLRSYMLNDPIAAEEMINEIDSLIPGELNGENGPLETGLSVDRDFESYMFKFRSSFSSLGVAVFIAFFVGIMFLVVTGSVLYYKQMAESDNDAQRYRTLSNIGMSKKQISGSVAIQLGLIFGVPFIFGTIDALFALRMLDCVIPQKLMLRAMMVIVIYAVMYSLYYVITWKNYKKKVLA